MGKTKKVKQIKNSNRTMVIQDTYRLRLKKDDK